MSKLLSAGFLRLKKSKVFFILAGFMFAFGSYMSVSGYMDMKKYQFTHTLEDVFFTQVMLTGIVTAVFCSLFIGTEYSDGTIRNKLIVGHSRISIYISNLIVCMAAGIAFSLSYMAACACVGIPLLGFFQMDPQTAVLLVLCSMVISIAYTSVFTLAAMLIHSKAVLSVVSVITAFLLMFAATYLYASLSQPEMVSDYVINESGEVTQSKPAPNPFYLTGTKRKVHEFLLEFLPSGQTFLIINRTPFSARIFLYDGLIFICAAGIGLSAFLKKDIK